VFQCSSASRKFLNRTRAPKCALVWRFSALQRAENSSIGKIVVHQVLWSRCFSALQRAENSSIQRTVAGVRRHPRVSVLFSEPKIPQCVVYCARSRSSEVSVLFSEPKIPQSIKCIKKSYSPHARFSALQRAENSSIGGGAVIAEANSMFQCSSASRKFLNICVITPERA